MDSQIFFLETRYLQFAILRGISRKRNKENKIESIVANTTEQLDKQNQIYSNWFAG